MIQNVTGYPFTSYLNHVGHCKPYGICWNHTQRGTGDGWADVITSHSSIEYSAILWSHIPFKVSRNAPLHPPSTLARRQKGSHCILYSTWCCITRNVIELIPNWRDLFFLFYNFIGLDRLGLDATGWGWQISLEIFVHTCGMKWIPLYTALTDGWWRQQLCSE